VIPALKSAAASGETATTNAVCRNAFANKKAGVAAGFCFVSIRQN